MTVAREQESKGAISPVVLHTGLQSCSIAQVSNYRQETTMAYMVTWGIFLDTDSTDPVEIARAARERVIHDPNTTTWKVSNLDTGEINVVDIGAGQTLPGHIAA